jgi:hypothetical protein
MSQSFAARLLSSRLIRNLLAIAGTLVLTFFVFRGVAAFNDVLKMYNALPVAQPEPQYTCPKGYVLSATKSGGQECIPAPSATKGVVSVGVTAPSSVNKSAPPSPPANKPPVSPP